MSLSLILAHFSFLPLTGCGGPVVAHSGEIHSPAYPNNYPHNVDCSWVISVDPSHRVFLNFSDLDIEQQSSCYFDYVAVSFTPWSHSFQIKSKHPCRGQMSQTANVPVGRSTMVQPHLHHSLPVYVATVFLCQSPPHRTLCMFASDQTPFRTTEVSVSSSQRVRQLNLNAITYS